VVAVDVGHVDHVRVAAREGGNVAAARLVLPHVPDRSGPVVQLAAHPHGGALHRGHVAHQEVRLTDGDCSQDTVTRVGIFKTHTHTHTHTPPSRSPTSDSEVHVVVEDLGLVLDVVEGLAGEEAVCRQRQLLDAHGGAVGDDRETSERLGQLLDPRSFPQIVHHGLYGVGSGFGEAPDVQVR